MAGIAQDSAQALALMGLRGSKDCQQAEVPRWRIHVN
jgi:hypothetical protein